VRAQKNSDSVDLGKAIEGPGNNEFPNPIDASQQQLGQDLMSDEEFVRGLQEFGLVPGVQNPEVLEKTLVLKKTAEQQDMQEELGAVGEYSQKLLGDSVPSVTSMSQGEQRADGEPMDSNAQNTAESGVMLSSGCPEEAGALCLDDSDGECWKQKRFVSLLWREQSSNIFFRGDCSAEVGFAIHTVLGQFERDGILDEANKIFPVQLLIMLIPFCLFCCGKIQTQVAGLIACPTI